MSERCPLDGTNAFYRGESIPEICRKTCEALWDAAVRTQKPDHEEYPDYILSQPECSHPSTEFGSDSLQSSKNMPGIRFYGTTERCLSCDDEIAEDSFRFECPNT